MVCLQPHGVDNRRTYKENIIMDAKNQIIIYQTADKQTQIDVRMENDTVWLTQAQMAELFQTDRTSIVRHINKIYADDELDRDSTCAKLHKFKKRASVQYGVAFHILIWT